MLRKVLCIVTGLVIIGSLFAASQPTQEVWVEEAEGKWISPPEKFEPPEDQITSMMQPHWIQYWTGLYYGTGGPRYHATRFRASDFGLMPPFQILRLRNWIGSYGYTYRFLILAPNHSTILYASPWLSSTGSLREYVLPSPVTIQTNDFDVVSEIQEQSGHYADAVDPSHSYYSWDMVYWYWWSYVEFIISAYVQQAGGGAADIEVKINIPPHYLTSGITYTPTAYVRNRGSENANNIAVACSIWTLGSLEYADARTIPNLGGWAATQVEFDDWDCTGFCGQEYIVKMSSDFVDDSLHNNQEIDTCVVTQVLLATWNFEPTDDGFTHTTYRCDLDCWEWGAPSQGGASYSGYPGTPPTPPYCWGTKINDCYPPCYLYSSADGRLKSPAVDLPAGSRKVRLQFQHWFYFYYLYAGGNVKLSKDGGSFDLITPVGGYPYEVYPYGCLASEPAFTYYGSGGWKEVTFDVDLEPPVNQVQFAWDFGAYYNYYCWGWAIDNVRVMVRYPPVAIADIGGIPALVGINCCYIPTAKVRNQWRRDLGPVDVLRRIGRVPWEPGPPEYESYQAIASLAKDTEQEVSFDEWCAPPEPGITLYDTVMVGMGGAYVDTLFRFFITGADIAAISALEPIDSMYTKTTYYPVATIAAEIGCDVPYTCTLQLRDSTGYVLYLSEADGIITGTQERIFDSLSVDEPGWYTFVLVARYRDGEPDPNDTLRWDVLAKQAGALDVGTDAITMPPEIHPDESIFPEATVQNYGQIPATFDVECKIEPGDYKDTKTVTNLEPGVTFDVDFKEWKPAEPGDYKVTVTTLLDDTDSTNNSRELTVSVTGVAEQPLPTEFELSCIRPNPMSDQTVISYQLPVASKVSLAIYDISGKLVKTLVNRHSSPGYYTVNWDGRNAKGKNVAAGIYFVKLLTPEYKATRKVVLLAP